MKIETIADHGLSPGTPNNAIYPNTCTSAPQEKNRNILVHHDLVSNEVIHPNTYATLSHKNLIAVPVHDLSPETNSKRGDISKHFCFTLTRENSSYLSFENDIYDSGISENHPGLVVAEKTFKDNSMFSIDSTVRLWQ